MAAYGRNIRAFKYASQGPDIYEPFENYFDVCAGIMFCASETAKLVNDVFW